MYRDCVLLCSYCAVIGKSCSIGILNKGRKVNLLEFIRRNRSTFVLKPNDDYGGHGVYFGAQLDEHQWDNAIETALSVDYVVQDALDLHPEVFPIFSENNWKLQPMFVDTNPFCSAAKSAAQWFVYQTRQSSTSLQAAAKLDSLFCKSTARPDARLQLA
jgi:hypothetical protein